jgi:quinol monooxygenase YgiN
MQHRWSILPGAAMAALAACLPAQYAQAQTPSQQQYVVFYGEFKPDPYSISQGTRTLDYLTQLAHQSAGVVHFASYAEIGRPNFFSLIEVWKDSASFTAFESASNTQKVLGELQPYMNAPLDERDGNLVE